MAQGDGCKRVVKVRVELTSDLGPPSSRSSLRWRVELRRVLICNKIGLTTNTIFSLHTVPSM